MKLEIIVRDEDLQGAVAAIIESARTGEIGDGKVFIYDVAMVSMYWISVGMSPLKNLLMKPKNLVPILSAQVHC